MIVSHKWTRATQKRTRRKPVVRGTTMKLFREIADGYAYFLARRTKAAAKRAEAKVKRPN